MAHNDLLNHINLIIWLNSELPCSRQEGTLCASIPSQTQGAATASLSHAVLCWHLCPRNQTQLGSDTSTGRNPYEYLHCDDTAAIRAFPCRFVHRGAHLPVLRQTCYKSQSGDASLATFGALWCVLAGGIKRSKAGGFISISLKSVPLMCCFYYEKKKIIKEELLA